jgi:hypothetical protein
VNRGPGSMTRRSKDVGLPTFFVSVADKGVGTEEGEGGERITQRRPNRAGVNAVRAEDVTGAP